jgi:Lon-like protease
MDTGSETITGSPPDPYPTDEAPQRQISVWALVAIAAFVLVSAIVTAGFLIHVPYTTLSPGDAVPLSSLVRVEGARTFPTPRGDIRLLFVRERNHVSLWRYLLAETDGDTTIVKENEINPGKEPQEDLNAEAEADMASAKIGATKVALEAAGYTVKPNTDGLVVLASLPSRPAGKVLKANDVIVAADGTRITEPDALRRAIGKHRAGEAVTLSIVRDGKSQILHVRVGVVEKTPSIGVIVSPRFDFPVKVEVDTAGIGGPSGGLAMTLAILDDLTPGNLTGGARTAVTGTIDADGNVGEIGGIAQKAVAARAAHARLFLVPKCATPETRASCEKDLSTAQRRAGKDVKVIPVATFQEALRVLRDNGGDPVDKVAGPGKAA